MKIKIVFLYLLIFGLLINCNKTSKDESQNTDESNVTDTLLNQINYNEDITNNSYYDNRSNYTYGFAVFKVYNDLNQRLNDIRRNSNSRLYPVEYNIVSKITTFAGPATEEAKFRVLDEEQSYLNRNLKILERNFLIFNSYEDASKARAEY